MHTGTILGVLALFTVLLHGKSEKAIWVQRFICSGQDNMTIQDAKCFSKSVNRSMRLLQGDLIVTRPMSNISVNAVLYKKTVVSYKPFLVNVTENLCDFLGKNRGGIYIRTIMKLIAPYSNINHPCPYCGPVYVRNMPVIMNNFLSLWPAGEYRLDLLISEEHKLVLLIQVFFETK